MPDMYGRLTYEKSDLMFQIKEFMNTNHVHFVAYKMQHTALKNIALKYRSIYLQTSKS